MHLRFPAVEFNEEGGDIIDIPPSIVIHDSLTELLKICRRQAAGDPVRETT